MRLDPFVFAGEMSGWSGGASSKDEKLSSEWQLISKSSNAKGSNSTLPLMGCLDPSANVAMIRGVVPNSRGTGAWTRQIDRIVCCETDHPISDGKNKNILFWNGLPTSPSHLVAFFFVCRKLMAYNQYLEPTVKKCSENLASTEGKTSGLRKRPSQGTYQMALPAYARRGLYHVRRKIVLIGGAAVNRIQLVEVLQGIGECEERSRLRWPIYPSQAPVRPFRRGFA